MRPELARLDRARGTDLARVLPELLDEIPELPAPCPLPEHEQRLWTRRQVIVRFRAHRGACCRR
jgi:hypothetical protein